MISAKAGEALGSDFSSPLRVGAITGIARCFQQLGDFRYAGYLLEGYLLQLRQEGLTDPTALMRTNASLVAIYFATGLMERAVEVAREARRLEVRVTDPEQVACMNINVARVLLYEGKVDEAVASLRKAEDIFANFGWKTEVARANIALGMVHAKQDEIAQARRYYEEALDLLAGSPDILDEARVRNELARLERLSGNGLGAQAQAHRVIEIMDTGDPRVRAFAHRELGLGSPDNLSESVSHLRMAIDLYRNAKDPIETASTFRALGDLYRAHGAVEEMAASYREGIEAVEERSY